MEARYIKLSDLLDLPMEVIEDLSGEVVEQNIKLEEIMGLHSYSLKDGKMIESDYVGLLV